jgi:2'-5' RNA ligase
MIESLGIDSVASASLEVPPGETLRVFYALWPDVETHAALARITATVAAATGGRAPAPENVHLTLAFVGEIAAERLPALIAIGARTAATVDAFTLCFDRVGTFRSSGIAWLGTGEAPPALRSLAEGLALELAAGAFRTDRRAFHAHVTLARHCRRPPPASAATTVTWPVRAMTLTASLLEREGARYRNLAVWPLGNPQS